jgi:hypothetical protein
MSLYMFRALNAHLQEDTLFTCSTWYCHSVNSSWWPVGALFEFILCTDRPPQTLVESDSTICCMYTVYPLEDEHLRLETFRGT